MLNHAASFHKMLNTKQIPTTTNYTSSDSYSSYSRASTRTTCSYSEPNHDATNANRQNTGTIQLSRTFGCSQVLLHPGRWYDLQTSQNWRHLHTPGITVAQMSCLINNRIPELWCASNSSHAYSQYTHDALPSKQLPSHWAPQLPSHKAQATVIPSSSSVTFGATVIPSS